MAQAKTLSWTNPATAVARALDFGFDVAMITTIDVTNGGSWQWINGMPNAYYLDVDAGTITTTNGFTPLSESARFGAAVSGFTNANPGVITVDSVSRFGFAIGDTIKVTAIADDQSAATSLNGNFTIASVSTSANTITLVEDTSAYSVWVSGGYVTRVSDINGDPVPTDNVSIYGITAGTGVVGANSAAMVAIGFSEESVV